MFYRLQIDALLLKSLAILWDAGDPPPCIVFTLRSFFQRELISVCSRLRIRLSDCQEDAVLARLMDEFFEFDIYRFEPHQGCLRTFARQRVYWRVLDSVRHYCCHRKNIERLKEQCAPQTPEDMVVEKDYLHKSQALILNQLRKNTAESNWQIFKGRYIDGQALSSLSEEYGLHRSNISRRGRKICDILQQKLVRLEQPL